MSNSPTTNVNDLERAKQVLALEAAGLTGLAQSLNGALSEALDILQNLSGRIIVTGMGKSGHVANKIAATLASTGKPAFFIHPGEASHGDLGMIGDEDAVIALSNSGETPELSDIIAYTRRFKIPLISITSGANSTMATESDVALILPPAEEACVIGLAPTTSTTMMMAYGDVLAVVLMERQGFTAEDFKLRHPGGRLGLRLLKVADIMHSGAALPVAKGSDPMTEVLPEMTAKSLGCIGIIDDKGALAGIVTDGDLRRHMADDILNRTAAEVMTPSAKTIRPSALASEALQIMNDAKITSLFVADENKVVGLLHIHDCLRAGIA
ncbi:MAG: KpsF/GutQ family sugar-phosphate isomerase [Rhodospirillaceae bacterium]|jgi:arabinose-5-phosphate isomerase|nr:KpsF/GutQ family sugar-phosphate isomerase [Rhodospirillaceae bacterium]MBT4589520.1 KpsF/GutQ family sugar-phosphate isomerase [Rhodospirillaceae bacterium]MBT5941612.1 KpsF/GutQ family sugar-phosphate isomerase [Rhodospirillaceae bacterium]MBT7268778.1 KpsF/GutQ family sugar-phosphate isomerase [Rhodospirillaceae bacterium]